MVRAKATAGRRWWKLLNPTRCLISAHGSKQMSDHKQQTKILKVLRQESIAAALMLGAVIAGTGAVMMLFKVLS